MTYNDLRKILPSLTSFSSSKLVRSDCHFGSFAYTEQGTSDFGLYAFCTYQGLQIARLYTTRDIIKISLFSALIEQGTSDFGLCDIGDNMPDYQYEFTELGTFKDSHTARLAVLWPTIGSQHLDTAAKQLAALPALLMLWRDRIKELGQDGWDKLTPLHARYLRNCMPTMGKVVELNSVKLGKTCKIDYLCPWCYARRIKLIFNKTCTHIEPDTTKLYYSRMELAIKSPSGVFMQAITVKQFMSFYRNIASKLATANSKTSFGTYWTVTAAPSLKDPDTLLMICGIVSLMDKSETFDLVPSTWTEQYYLPPVTQDDAMTAVSRALHYPVGLLNGSSEATIEILKAREKFRLSDAYGCYRGI